MRRDERRKVKSLHSVSVEIFERYQVRKTKRQKTAFIEYIRAAIPEAAVEGGGFGGSRNIVVGDVKTAKVVFGAHYDTCAVMPFPNFLTPKNFLIYALYSVLICIPIFLLAGGVNILLRTLGLGNYAAYWCGLAALWVFVAMMIVGPANRHTANDNTSGVIELCEIYFSLAPEEREKAAFVFFDNEEKGLLGSSYFRKVHREDMKNKLLINFDCVSDGGNIMLIFSKSAENRYLESLKEAFNFDTGSKTILFEKAKGTLYPSDQKNFGCSVGVAAFKRGILGLYMDRIHTPADTVFDENNIEIIRKASAEFIKKM